MTTPALAQPRAEVRGSQPPRPGREMCTRSHPDTPVFPRMRALRYADTAAPHTPIGETDHAQTEAVRRAPARDARSISSLLAAAGAVLLPALLLPTAAKALECGEFTFPKCSGDDVQYAGRFNPKVGHGGFGGGACIATKTPVVFIHGNGDRAINWASPVVGTVKGHVPPKRSVYDEFKHRGYNDCELFGITYLTRDRAEERRRQLPSSGEVRDHPRFHQCREGVHGKGQSGSGDPLPGSVDDLGRTGHHDAWKSVRRFVNIAGGIRGLNSCLFVGPANPMATTCGSESFLAADVFGFYPDSLFAPNGWTGSTEQPQPASCSAEPSGCDLLYPPCRTE